MRSNLCYFSNKRNHLVAQCIPWTVCPCPICFKFSHLHSLPLMVRLYHTAALFKRHLPSNFIRQLAQLFTDAFGLFLVTMHDGILKQSVKSLSAPKVKYAQLLFPIPRRNIPRKEIAKDTIGLGITTREICAKIAKRLLQIPILGNKIFPDPIKPSL